MAHWRIGWFTTARAASSRALLAETWRACILAEGVARGLPLVLAALKTLGEGSVRIQDRLPLNAAGELMLATTLRKR